MGGGGPWGEGALRRACGGPCLCSVVVKQLEVLARGLPWGDDKVKAVKLWRSGGQRTSGCTGHKCDEELLMTLARHHKLAAARMWVAVFGLGVPAFVTAGDAPESDAAPDGASPAFTPEEAQLKHVLAVVVSFGALRSLECPVWRSFLGSLQPRYTAASRGTARTMLETWAQRIAAKLEQHMSACGPWSLMTDGATVRRSPFINVIVRNGRGQELLLDHAPASG